MVHRIYRVCRARYARLDGEGAKQVGGRWNSPGRAMVYMVETVALSVLENLVHMSRQDFPTGYVCIAAILPASINMASQLELKCRGDLRELSSQSLGDWWIEANLSAVLEVESVIVPSEHNYLLNPAHPDFARITTEPPLCLLPVTGIRTAPLSVFPIPSTPSRNPPLRPHPLCHPGPAGSFDFGSHWARFATHIRLIPKLLPP